MARKSLLKKTLPDLIPGSNFKQSIKNFFKDTPNSVLFWNGMIYLAFIIGLFIDYNWPLSIVTGLGSILVIGMAFDGDEDFNEKQLWIPLTGIFWVILIIAGVGYLLYLLYKRTIVPFNNWLNKEPVLKESPFQPEYEKIFEALVKWHVSDGYTEDEARKDLHESTIQRKDYTGHCIVTITYINGVQDIVKITPAYQVIHLNPAK